MEGIAPIAKEEFTSLRFDLLFRAAQAADLKPSALRILMATTAKWMRRENGGAFYASLTTICAELGVRRTAARAGLADLVAAQIFTERKFPGETSLFLPIWTDPNPSANPNGLDEANPSGNPNRSRRGNPSNFTNRFRVVTSANPSANANHHRFVNANGYPSANPDTIPVIEYQRDNSGCDGALKAPVAANVDQRSLRSSASSHTSSPSSPASALRFGAASPDERDIYAMRDVLVDEPMSLPASPSEDPARLETLDDADRGHGDEDADNDDDVWPVLYDDDEQQEQQTEEVVDDDDVPYNPEGAHS
ncbi:MAG: hypothetical protein JOZ16_01160 [Methylobacteriaceae bacterium]|nr:hypothetical protein [Methylobacteriaceae bacterium]